MNARLAPPADAPTVPTGRDARLLLLARAALIVGALTAVAFTAVTVLTSRVPDEHAFRSAADYWYTGLGMLPGMAAPLVLVIALHLLQRGRDGWLGLIGTLLTVASLSVFLAMGVDAMIVGEASSFGPTYVLAMAVSFAGITLLAIGSWRGGLLPGWLAAFWIIAWILGGPAGQLVTPLLLAAAYLTMAARLPARVQALSA